MKIEQSICFDLILRRSELRTLTGLHAGHYPLNYHIHEMGLAVSNECWLCKEHVETAKHVLCVINMKRLEKVKFWQLLWRFEIKSCHSRIMLMGVRRREVPYDLCQTVCEGESDPFQLSRCQKPLQTMYTVVNVLLKNGNKNKLYVLMKWAVLCLYKVLCFLVGFVSVWHSMIAVHIILSEVFFTYYDG